MENKYYIKLIKLMSFLIFAGTLFSCKEADLNPVFDNINDPEIESYKPDTPQLVKIESITESGAVITWVFDYTRGGVNLVEANEISFQLEIGNENKSSFGPVAFEDSPEIVYSANYYLIMKAKIKYNFTPDKLFSLRMKSIRKDKNSAYTDILYGKAFLGAACDYLMWDYRTNGGGKMSFYWRDDLGDSDNAILKRWNCVKGYKFLYREVKSPEIPFRELKDIPRSAYGYIMYEGLNVSSLVKGTEYEFAVVAYSETQQTQPVIKKWKYD